MKELDFNNIKNDLLNEYKKEQKRLNNLNDHLEIKNSLESLNYIKKEIYKYDELATVFDNKDIDYRIMKLENLYMQLSYDISKEEFKHLSIESKLEIFENIFPSNWAISIPKEEKLELLLDAITINQMISIESKKSKKG